MLSCCIAAVVPEWPDSRLPLVNMDQSTASKSCNSAISLTHEGYHLDGSDMSWACTPCTRVVQAATTCPEGSREGASLATSIYIGSKTKTQRNYCAFTATFGLECLACTPAASKILAPMRPRVGATVHISSSCQHVQPNGRAWLELGREHLNMTLHGHGGVMLVDEFPIQIGVDFKAISVTVCLRNSTEECVGTLMADLDNATYIDPWPRLSGPADAVAFELTEPADVLLDRVFAPTCRALLSVRPQQGTDATMAVGQLTVTGAARAFVVALSHVTVRDSAIECRGSANHLLIQERRGSNVDINVLKTDDGNSTCQPTIDLSDLLGVYGRQYEVEYYHNGVIRKRAPLLVQLLNRALTYSTLILGALIIFAHEGDIRRLLRQSARA